MKSLAIGAFVSNNYSALCGRRIQRMAVVKRIEVSNKFHSGKQSSLLSNDNVPIGCSPSIQPV